MRTSVSVGSESALLMVSVMQFATMTRIVTASNDFRLIILAAKLLMWIEIRRTLLRKGEHGQRSSLELRSSS